MEHFDPLAVLAAEAAPQPTVAEAHALEMAVVQTAMSSLFSNTAALTPELIEPAYEEASEQNQDSEPHDQRANPKAIGRSEAKRQSSKTQGR